MTPGSLVSGLSCGLPDDDAPHEAYCQSRYYQQADSEGTWEQGCCFQPEHPRRPGFRVTVHPGSMACHLRPALPRGLSLKGWCAGSFCSVQDHWE